jgi:hypothetical protein
VNRDFQKQRVYDWENGVIRPISPRNILFKDAQAFVDGVFLKHGWLYPPKVSLIPKQATKVLATGSRSELRLRPVTPAWIIIHELAHTLTSTIDGKTDRHGPDFVGIYIKLLESVLDIPVPMTMFTLTKSNIKFNLGAKPHWEK